MCGLTGFFTGCEFESQCQKSPAACPHRLAPKLFENWHTKASVRRAPRRVLNPEDTKLDLFPRDLVPVATHPILQRKYPEMIPELLSLWLFRYLTFTINLETLVVNTTTQQLVAEKLPVRLNPEQTLTAYKLYCDEAYHALFCADLLKQVVDLTNYRKAQPVVPSFLKVFRDAEVRAEDPILERFIFTAVSEMLITVSLNNVRENQKEQTPKAIRNIMTDHSMDEIRHHAFYRDVLAEFLKSQPRNKVAEIVSVMPDYVMAFIEPDIENINIELRSIGLSTDEAQQVVEETYKTEVVKDYANVCSKNLSVLMQELELSEIAQTQDSFGRIGVVV